MSGRNRTTATVVAPSSPANRSDGRSASRRWSHARLYEQKTKTTRHAIVLSLFLVFLASVMLIGGRSYIGPMLQAAARARAANQTGSVIVTMPGGTLCRRLSFDNQTAELSETSVQRCSQSALQSAEPGRASNGFTWGAR
jgi:hypothetical protein